MNKMHSIDSSTGKIYAFLDALEVVLKGDSKTIIKELYVISSLPELVSYTIILNAVCMFYYGFL